MILENQLDRAGFGYARLLMAAHHTDGLEWGTEGMTGHHRVDMIWGYSLISVHEELDGHHGSEDSIALVGAFDQLFPGLRERMWAAKVNGNYNNDPDQLHAQSIWMVQAHREDLLQLWLNLFDMVKAGPQGADDDTFDYWPSAWGVMLDFAEDLIALGVTDNFPLREAQSAWDDLVKFRHKEQLRMNREYRKRSGATEVKDETLEETKAYMDSEIASRPVLVEE